jgi:hypothetical protein
MVWIAPGFNSFWVGGPSFSARSGAAISGTECMVPQSFAARGNRSYPKFCAVTGGLSYPIFMPKPSTHCMHDSGSILPHIRRNVLTDNQMPRIKYNYYISNVSKDYDESQWNGIAEDSITP